MGRRRRSRSTRRPTTCALTASCSSASRRKGCRWPSGIFCFEGSRACESGAVTRLPNGDRAEVDLRKLSAYCLSPTHPRGRHKARVFREALGITQADANELRARTLSAARDEIAVLLDADEWGERWRVDITISRQRRR